ncbi:hypothetical protein BHM03_00048678 [Ensete ventricosum]|nr:hypothetical protein BHM03_00048678 [Ensete ventricosum]
MAVELLVMMAAFDLVGLIFEANAVLIEENEAFVFDQYAWQHLVQGFLVQQAGMADRQLGQTDVRKNVGKEIKKAKKVLKLKTEARPLSSMIWYLKKVIEPEGARSGRGNESDQVGLRRRVVQLARVTPRLILTSVASTSGFDADVANELARALVDWIGPFHTPSILIGQELLDWPRYTTWARIVGLAEIHNSGKNYWTGRDTQLRQELLDWPRYTTQARTIGLAEIHNSGKNYWTGHVMNNMYDSATCEVGLSSTCGDVGCGSVELTYEE